MASTRVNGVALVTGAASGIGKDTAFAFAESGALRVVFADCNETGAREAAEVSKAYATNPNYSAIAVHVEVTDVNSVQNMIEVALEGKGRIDHFVHSAGVGSQSALPISESSLDEIDRAIDINLKGTLICNRAVLKVMSAQESRTFSGRHGPRDVGRGTIVNIGSLASLGPLPGKIPYTVSKHGVHAITRVAALENAKLGVRVNMICPSWVVSNMTDMERKVSPELDAMVKMIVPSGRMAFPDEVSEMIVFLSSPAASFITGQAIVIDNGMTLTAKI